MRKMSIYGIAAAAMIFAAGTVPSTVYGAEGAYRRQNRAGISITISGCGNTDLRPERPNSIPGSGNAGRPDGEDALTQDMYIQQTVELVNAERAKAGKKPLELNMQAVQAAQVRAKELAASFSHTRPNGTSFSTALTASGISFRRAGENIAYGQRTPEAVMNSWMNSSGHRANILSENFNSIGIGHYQDSSGTDYWVQLFFS